MMLSAALAISSAQAQPAPTASMAALQAFKEGCTEGTLKISPDRGYVLKSGERGPDLVTVLGPFRGNTKRTVIKLNYPRSTYLVFAEYKDVPPLGIERKCVLVSSAVTKEDAVRALLETAPGKAPKQSWVPDMHLPEWTIDVPRQGYRSRMKVRPDNSILLEVANYRARAR